MNWQHAALTDRGLKRPRNEDALLACPARGLYAVADGMGGHAAGDVASALAITTLDAALPRPLSSRIGIVTLSRRLAAAFRTAHEAILAQAAHQPEQAGMGTTLTVLTPLPGRPLCVVAHIGDSRAYRLRGSELLQLTRDHTWVQGQVDAGMLTPVRARSHPWASVLTRVLGGTRSPAPDIVHVDVAAHDLFLLCSDGLTAVIEDADLQSMLLQPLALDVLARQLVQAALLRGGPDNITVILVRAQPLVAEPLRSHLREPRGVDA